MEFTNQQRLYACANVISIFHGNGPLRRGSANQHTLMHVSYSKPQNKLENAIVASPLACVVSRSSRLGPPRLYKDIQATKGLTKGYHNPRRKLTDTVESEVLWTWFRPKRWCDYFAGRVLQVCPVFVKVHWEILTAHSPINHYTQKSRTKTFKYLLQFFRHYTQCLQIGQGLSR